MSIYVYLITRTDNVKYVGITLNMNKRNPKWKKYKIYRAFKS
jgi:predicted GIY-YIG superfamily endonuclease